MGRDAPREEGVAILELCLVVPVFFLLILGGLEFSLVLTRYQEITSLSRELARRAQRECLVGPGALGSDYDPRTCSSALLNGFNAQMAQLIPNGTATLTYCSNESTGVTCTSVPNSANSSYELSDFTASGTLLSNSLSNYNSLIIAEITAPSSVLAGTGTSMFGFAPGMLYATTII